MEVKARLVSRTNVVCQSSRSGANLLHSNFAQRSDRHRRPVVLVALASTQIWDSRCVCLCLRLCGEVLRRVGQAGHMRCTSGPGL